MRKANYVLLFCLAGITGIFCTSFYAISFFYIYLLFLAAILLAVFYFFSVEKKQALIIGAIFLLGFCLGAWRFYLSLPGANSVLTLSESQFNVQANIHQAPLSKLNKQTFVVDQIIIGEKKYSGKILVTTDLYPEYKINQRLKLICNLKTPGQIEDFDYGKYLANQGIYKLCYYPHIYIQTDEPQYFWLTKVGVFFAQARTAGIRLVNDFVPSPIAGLLSAMLLGDRSELDQNLLDKFSQAGVVHVISISGTHITLLSGIIFFILLFLGFSRAKSFWLITLFLFFYLLLIGFNAPAIRSAVMGLIMLYGLKEGRLSAAGRAVIIAAWFLLLLNPRLLVFDVGFELSFLSTLGLVYFSPYISFGLKKILPWSGIRSVTAMTLAAQIATWPLVSYYFGLISVIAPIANLLILSVPAVTIFMVSGIFFLIVATCGLGGPFVFLCVLPIWLTGNYLIKISFWCVQIPFGYFYFSKFGWGWMLFCYAIIIILFWQIKNRTTLDE